MGKRLYAQVENQLGDGPDWRERINGTWWWISALTDEAPE
jgi:hypothetical protein